MARVFLCEDDTGFRMLTRVRLEMLGHEVVGECADRALCVAEVIDCDPDVALLDGILEANDWDTLRAGAARTKLVLLSGLPNFTLQAEAQRMQADAWISKNAAPEALAGLIDRLCRERDLAADERDAAAGERDRRAAGRDLKEAINDAILRGDAGEEDRDRAAALRRGSAEDRRSSAVDRSAAADDRTAAALDRRAAASRDEPDGD